jgi:predicted ATPase
MKPRSFTLANFKAFGPTAQEIPLKPITLVFGPNSAGKSSLIHSVLWLNQYLQDGF